MLPIPVRQRALLVSLYANREVRKKINSRKHFSLGSGKYSTPGPRHSRGIRSGKTPHMLKPRMWGHCFNGKWGGGDRFRRFPNPQKICECWGKSHENAGKCGGNWRKSTNVGVKLVRFFIIVTMETRGITLSVHGRSWFMKKGANGNTKVWELVQWGHWGNVIGLQRFLVQRGKYLKFKMFLTTNAQLKFH